MFIDNVLSRTFYMLSQSVICASLREFFLAGLLNFSPWAGRKNHLFMKTLQRYNIPIAVYEFFTSYFKRIIESY